MALSDSSDQSEETDDLDRRKLLGMVGGLMMASAGVSETASAEPVAEDGTDYEIYGVFSDAEDPDPAAIQAVPSMQSSTSGSDGGIETNGCGAEGGVDVPDGNWGHCCDQHDRCYARGGYRSDRLACDQALRDCMEPIAGSFIASSYYWGVRWGGTSAFNWYCTFEEPPCTDPTYSR